MALAKRETLCKIALLLTVTLLIVISETNGKPTPKPCEKDSSCASKRKHSDTETDNDIVGDLDDIYDENYYCEPAKRRKSKGTSGKSKKDDENELKNPFEAIECNKIYYSKLHNLANQDLNDDVVYGFHREEADTMVFTDDCKLTSFSVDDAICRSLDTQSNRKFYSLDIPRYTAYQTILATFSHYDPTNDVKLGVKYLRSHSNIQSYISYFLFTVTDQVEKIIAKLKRVPWDSDFHNVLSRSEYQVLKSNLVYVGSGQTKRPFEHVTYTNYLLNGITMKNTQKIHYFLAKGVRQNLFQKVLIVPFFSSNNYAGCLYSEQATIWVLGNHTLNNKFLEFDKIKHKVCVERSDPEKYLKNVFSKRAFQFVADFNVESGIRQIGKFGIVLDLEHNAQRSPEEKRRFRQQYYLTPAFIITKKSTMFYKFGSQNMVTRSPAELPLGNQLQTESWTQMLPFDKLDFVFANDFDGWIERTRLANEIMNYLIPTLSAYPLLLNNAKKELEKPFIDELKNENLNIQFVEKLKHLVDTNLINKSPPEGKITLSAFLAELHFILIGARNEKENHNENQIFEIEDKCQHFVSHRLSIFEASLEHHLYKRLIFSNPDVLRIGKIARESDDEKMFTLEVPEKFVNMLFTRYSNRPKRRPDPNNKIKFQCPYCGKILSSEHNIKLHIQSVQGAKNYVCNVCRQSFTALSYLKNHELTQTHRLLAIGQSEPVRSEMLEEPLIGQYSCPVCRKTGKHRYFATEENAEEHMKQHIATREKPENRLGEQNRNDLGVFTCLYDGRFKTNRLDYASYHMKGVHGEHLPKTKTTDVTPHFIVEYSRLPFAAGNFRCLVCGRILKSTQDTQAHLIGDAHYADYERVLRGEKIEQTKCPKLREILKPITKELAETVVRLKTETYKKHPTKNIKKYEDLTFLDDFILHFNNRFRRFFFQIPDEDGIYYSDSDCHFTEKTAFYNIAKDIDLVEGFWKDEYYSEKTKLKERYTLDDYLDTSKKRKPQKDLLTFLRDQKDFRDYVRINRKYILRDAFSDEVRMSITETIEIPDKCYKLEDEHVTGQDVQITDTKDEL